MNVAVGYLQRHAEEHGEYEEYGHFLALEELESGKAEGIGYGAFCVAVDRACGHRQCVGCEYEAENPAGDELHIAVGQRGAVYFNKVDKPLGGYETYGSEHTDGRKVLHGVKPSACKCVDRH